MTWLGNIIIERDRKDVNAYLMICSVKVSEYEEAIKEIKSQQEEVFHKLKKKFSENINSSNNLVELYNIVSDHYSTKKDLYTTYNEDLVWYYGESLDKLSDFKKFLSIWKDDSSVECKWSSEI
jgi:hypothetical protein